MSERGGEKTRVSEALQQAISHPLLEGRRIDGATAVLINVVAGSDLSIFEYNDILKALGTQVSEKAQIINGFREDHNYEDQLSITVIATGFERENTVTNPQKNMSRPDGAPPLRKIEGGYGVKAHDQNPDTLQQDLGFPNIQISEKNFNIPAFLRKK